MPCENRHPADDHHTFEPAQSDPNMCIAIIETATVAEHGFSHHAQCGHPRIDHDCGDD